MNKLYARQGDVGILSPIITLPEGAKKLKTNVVVYGESTGHSHQLVGGDIFRKDDVMYLVLEKGGKLVHQEHETITLESGIYPVIRQREYLSKDMTKVVVD